MAENVILKHNLYAENVKWDSYPDVHYGIKLGYKNIGWNGAFYTFPYFLAFLLKRFLVENKR